MRVLGSFSLWFCLAALMGGSFLGLSGNLAVGVARGEEGPAKEVVYKKTAETELKLWINYPADWQATDKRPAIVFFFGGGWNSGSPEQFATQAQYLASRGMIAARADYRVKSRHQVTPVQCVEDAKSAVRYLRANANRLGIDPQRIVSAGGSAGGHIAACTAFTPGFDAKGEDAEVSSRPNALALFNPVLKFSGVERLMERLQGDEAIGKALSPTLHVQKDSPPTLILFGTGDPLIEQGHEFVAAAKQAELRCELFTAEGQPHGFFNRSPWKERTLLRLDEFLVSLGYLTGKPTLEAP